MSLQSPATGTQSETRPESTALATGLRVEPQSGPNGSVNIAAIERDTGLSKDTLRVWERRYGFPMPLRNMAGERLYPLDQLDKLRLLKRLLDHGQRPGKIIHHSTDALLALLNRQGQAKTKNDAPLASAGSAQTEPQLVACLEFIKTHQIVALRHTLSQSLLAVGLAAFVSEVAAPLNTLVGEAWARGELAVFEEHLYTESIQIVLRNAINTIPASTGGPRVLLTTFPQEPHGLGILMADALFALENCHCISLGVQTPLDDIVNAAVSQQVDIVALSFTSIMNRNQVHEGLRQLRQQLPARIEIWVGGSNPALRRKVIDEIHVLPSLGAIRPHLQAWQTRRQVQTQVGTQAL